MRAWHVLPEQRWAIGAAAKCGSTSLRKALQGVDMLGCSMDDNERVHFDGVPVGYRKIGIVRNPIDRFYSLYNNIQQRERGPNNFYKQFEGKLPWDVLDGLIKVGLDYEFHFQPQHLIGLENADELVALEDLPQWWWPRFGTEFPHSNASEPGVAYGRNDDRVVNRLRQRYARDFALWERARGNE